MSKLILNKILLNVLIPKSQTSSPDVDKNAGFSLIELVAVILMIGILAAMALPAWLSFVNRQNLNKANDVILSAIQEAQREAKRQKVSYSVSFRTDNNIAQISIHPGATPTTWRNLGQDVGIKAEQVTLFTNLTATNKTTSSTSISYLTSTNTITFDYMGALDFGSQIKTNVSSVQTNNIGAKGLIIGVAPPRYDATTVVNDVKSKRCVVIKTLLGSTQTKKDDDCKVTS
jgi:prepilin-type N-terminal cleavage/methylation domain-containing protein